ncbi:MAG: lipid-A-disaccharide synthase, partial [Kiritimatiellae bacterium]|nr:lipid-A-disaccharide synthase [Kiritimatiellia bacterium]
MKKSLLIVAGEVSGDMHAARLVTALKEQAPEVECWGIGGPRLRACGMQTVHDVREMAVMGLSEVLRRYFFFRRVFHEMIRLAEERKPDAALLVDYPGFNVRLAEQLHRRGIKTLYYISPQVWAWHRSRIPKLAAILDRLMVIFPFEVEVFSGTGLAVDFVGHPLVEEAEKTRQDPLLRLPWAGERRVALLPGSRRHEVSRILPCMLEASVLLEKRFPDVCFILAAPSEEIRDVAEQVMSRQMVRPAHVSIVVDETRQVLRQARAAMVASGTATIETALQHCPMIVVYKTAWPTYLMARWLVRGVKHIGMLN